MATIWQAVVVVDGVDMSESITGGISVEAEESAARIASFSMRPPSGTVSAGDWLGVSVSIDYKTLNSSGIVLTQDRIFTGVVDQAIYDPTIELTRFDCTDDMQNKFESMTQAAIDALITGSRWSEAVFGEYQDGWLYLENLLESAPQAFDYNADGVTGTLANWAAKSIADFSFDTGSIFTDSINYSLAPRRELFNETTITYDYRFRRLKHREHDFSWSFAVSIPFWTFCTYYADAHEMPTREMVISAASGAGWKVQTPFQFGVPPESGVMCGGVWIISDELRQTLITAASWTAIKRWTQEVTETYTLTVNSPQSKAWLGTVAMDEVASNQTETDSEVWDEGIDTPIGARTDSQNDLVFDKVDRTVSDNDMETLIARARTEILSLHRGNWVEGIVELTPTNERYHTVDLDGGNVRGKGKVTRLIHEMNSDTGAAVTHIRVAVSLNGGLGADVDSTIEAPAAPDTDPATAAPTSTTSLPTYIGGKTGSATYDPDWTGFMGNDVPFDGGVTDDQIYPRRFRVDTPSVDQTAIDAASGDATGTYSFNIPNETLTITVP